MWEELPALSVDVCLRMNGRQTFSQVFLVSKIPFSKGKNCLVSINLFLEFWKNHKPKAGVNQFRERTGKEKKKMQRECWSQTINLYLNRRFRGGNRQKNLKAKLISMTKGFPRRICPSHRHSW